MIHAIHPYSYSYWLKIDNLFAANQGTYLSTCAPSSTWMSVALKEEGNKRKKERQGRKASVKLSQLVPIPILIP